MKPAPSFVMIAEVLPIAAPRPLPMAAAKGPEACPEQECVSAVPWADAKCNEAALVIGGPTSPVRVSLSATASALVAGPSPVAKDSVVECRSEDGQRGEHAQSDPDQERARHDARDNRGESLVRSRRGRLDNLAARVPGR
jgi:hypothetical protein